MSLDANGMGTLAADALAGGNSTDNCGTPTETSPMTAYTCADLGTQTVVLTADDGNGNIDMANCSVTVQDIIDPVAVCPTAPIVTLDASGNGTLEANALASGASTDNCTTLSESSPMTAFTCTELGTQTVVLTADDGNGNTHTANCSVTVEDNLSLIHI